MKLDSKIYLTAKERKVFLIDIGVWILILVKIYQIIQGVQMKIESINLPQLIIKFCIFVVVFWQLYGIINIASYDAFAIMNDALCTLIIGGGGLYLLYLFSLKDRFIDKVFSIRIYSILLIIYGFTQSIYASLSYVQFGSIVTLGVTLSIVSLILGLVLSSANFKDKDFKK
tara:strand:+ start:233 stop:745 length:513 start_codon:yes stop_codon:yes gene_type:complete